ncbi:leukocyte elastase inhibitor-like isoform X2 [Malaya genurostris]|uniref:leukocyte elastase inhibitor-like isoform X2 n=1 Tax=Malaya genurostris TaxID=325434 RepID=UPI0026F3D110|nr:leukocyte elastase inhibitor-like isoform X2 [Malaya genurostris]
MDKRYVLSVVALVISLVHAQTNVQVQNRQIWHNYCSAAARGNLFASYQAFSPICASYSPETCCDVVAQAIRSYPDMQLCRTKSGFQLGAVGCGVDRKTSSPEVPVRRSEPSPTTGTVPTSTVEVVEIVFNYNPHDNVRVSIPVPKTSTIQANSGSQRPTAGQKTQNARPTGQLGQQSQNPAPNRRPTPNEETSDYDEEMPAVMVNTPGYQATEFALNLCRSIGGPNNGDSVISPLLPQLLLANLVDVANPTTKQQLLKAIRLYPEQLDKLTKSLRDVSKSSVNTVEFASVNFVAGDLKLNKTYSEDARLRNVEVLAIDFRQPNQAARIANKWVSEKTHHLINEIVSPGSVSPDTRLLLANSIYFKGKWKYAFIQTEPAKFEAAPGHGQQVNSMYQLNKLRYGEINFPDDNGLRWVELPYEGDTLAMLIFLPTQRHQLEASFRQLRPEDLARVLAELDTSYIKTKVNVHLPKFTVTDSVSLNGALERLGVGSIFHDGDALRYLSNEATVVSDVTQRTYLSVDELGTKATSVASLSIVPLSITPEYREIRFNVDQPFLVMIVDKRERYPVFIGRIYDPQE